MTNHIAAVTFEEVVEADSEVIEETREWQLAKADEVYGDRKDLQWAEMVGSNDPFGEGRVRVSTTVYYEKNEDAEE